MKHIFIINPMAGKVDASVKLIPELETLSKSMEFEYEVVKTEKPGHGKDLALEFAKKYDGTGVRIYACGGDGTFNEVMNGVYESKCSNVEVGVVPCGTGNDYVKNYGKASDFQNLKNQILGVSIEVDILDTNLGVAGEICSVGFDANVGYNTRHYKKLPLCHGQMAYNLSVVECLLKPIGTHLKITVDGKVFEDDYLMACLANGTTYGGGFCCAPEADLCDGLIDVIIVNKVSRLYIAKIISKYANGSYQKNCVVEPEFEHCITYLRGKRISIEGPKDYVSNLDGECKVQKEIEVQLKEKAMKFIVPAGNTYKAGSK